MQLPFFSNSTESLKNISGLVSLQPEYVEPLTPRPTPSKEEVPDSGDDEVVGGESAMSYFKKLSGSIKDFINSRVSPIKIQLFFYYYFKIFQSGSGEKINVLAAYSYKDHFSATISIPKKIG